MKLLLMRCSLLVLLLAAHGLLAPAARATTTCDATTTSVTFGAVSMSGNTDVSATFSVTCTTLGLNLFGSTKARMCLGIQDGANGSNHFIPRRMLNGTGDPLDFQLYTDAARSQIWGARGNPMVPIPLGVDFDYPVSLFFGSQTKNITIYGRVPFAQAQALNAGAYANPFNGVHTRMEYRYDEGGIFGSTMPSTCSGGANVAGAFPFTVTATVPANCRAYAATDLDFGSVPGVISSNLDSTSTLTMTCTGRTAWKVGLNNGLHASGSIRRMRLGATSNHVTYELYREPLRTSRWGNTVGTNTVDGTGTGLVQALTVYGRIPAPQAPAAGIYGDTITVTITY